MAILVVGGAGYIGSHIVKMLNEEKREVVVLDNLEKGHIQAIGNSKLEKADLRDAKSLRKVFENNNIDSVMHFAAYSLVGESMQDPAKYYENNVYGTLNLLKTMVDFDVKKIIFSSTAAVYGEPEYIPIDEDHPKKPTNVYGETKITIERMLDWFDKIYSVKSVRLRYFNAAGADPSGIIGELHDPETHLIPIVLQAALGEREYISIFGDDYDTKDGTCVRDYIHVNDLAKAHILALEYLKSENKSNFFNLGNGNGYSVKEIIDVAKEVTNIDIPVKMASRRAGDPAILIASSEKIKKILGWKPRFYDIKTIISTAWKWHSGKAKEWKNG